jgi:hypothetical protein
MVEPIAAQEHGCRVKSKRKQQQAINDSIMMAKPLAPQKNRINHADAVNDDGQHEHMALGEPVHSFKISPAQWLCKR